MRQVSLALLLLAAACGSTANTVTPPPPPPGGQPATVTVQQGGGQQGEPGAVLPVHPAVLVRDVSGAPVAGVTVTFSIDSGGGALASASAVTGNDGVATAGAWTLGAAEGRDVVKVTVGSLAPVRIAATAAIVGGTFPSTTIGSGGGSYSVLQPGPLNGFKLDVPGGAIAGSVTFTISYSPGSTVAPIPGAGVMGPVITLSSSSAADPTLPLTVHVPFKPSANSIPQLFIYDAASGAREALTTVSWDSTGITAFLGVLTSSNIFGARGTTGGLRASLQETVTVRIITTEYPEDVLNAPYDTGFRPGVNDWEFPLTATVVDSFPVLGVETSALWYFLTQRAAPLWRKYQEAADVPLSNRRGMRWAAVVQLAFRGNIYQDMAASYLNHAGSKAVADMNQLVNVQAAMASGGAGPQPQLIILMQGTKPSDLVTVYQAHGKVLSVADPSFPGDGSRTITFNDNGMQPYTGHGGKQYNGMLWVSLSSLIPLSTFSSTFPQVVDGTIGQSQFPAYHLHTKYGLVGDTIWVADTLRLWAECPSCVPLITSPSAPEATGSLTGIDEWLLTPSNTLQGSSKVAAFDARTYHSLNLNFGFVVSQLEPQPDGSVHLPWIDWHPFLVLKVADTILVSPHPNGATVKATFTQQTQGPLRSQLQYTWDFNDGTPVVNVANNPATTHTYAAPGIYLIKGQILDPSTKQPLASTTLLDTVPAPQFAWKFVTASPPVITLPAGGIGSDSSDMVTRDTVALVLAQLTASPQNFRIFVADSTSTLDHTSRCRAILLEQFAPGQAVDSAFVENSFLAYLGVTPTAACTGPDFTGTFVMGTLGSGALTGSFLSVGPPSTRISGALINAVMSGTTLSGTFTLHVEYTTGTADYVVHFSATQVWPRP